jgi:hypothetical protein
MGGESGRKKAIIYHWFICRRKLKQKIIPFYITINQMWCCFTTAVRRRVSSNWMVKYQNIREEYEHFDESVVGRRRWEIRNRFPPFYWRFPTLHVVQMSVPCMVVQLLYTVQPANACTLTNRIFAFLIKSHAITQWTNDIIIENNQRNKLHFYNFSNECHCWSRIILMWGDCFAAVEDTEAFVICLYDCATHVGHNVHFFADTSLLLTSL